MNRLKTVLRVGGVVVAAIGWLFLPSSTYVFRKRQTSVFHNIADLGAFTQVGLVLISVGLIVLVDCNSHL